MNKEEIENFVKFFQKHYSDDLLENRRGLIEVMKIVSDLSDSLGDVKLNLPSWKYYSNSLIHKLIFTSNSIIKLSEGFEMISYDKLHRIYIIDFSSMYILTRVIIENFLTLDYIFINKLPDEQKFFRFKVWEMAGLMTRQNFSSEDSDFLEMKKKEKAVIDEIYNQIKQMPDFKNLNSKQLNSLNKFGLPRINSWHQLINESGLNKSVFSTTYSLFSNYAHSEYLSILQIQQSSMASDDIENLNRIKQCFAVVRIINSLVIKWILSEFPTSGIVYEKFSKEIKMVLEVWAQIGKSDFEVNNS